MPDKIPAYIKDLLLPELKELKNKIAGLEAKFGGLEAKFDGLSMKVDGLSAKDEAIKFLLDHLRQFLPEQPKE